MSTLTRAKFNELIQEEHSPSLSLYMPTRAAGGRDSQGEMIRFKNLVREAEKGLAEWGLKSREVEQFLKPLSPLFMDTPFWSYQSDGLAIFLHKDSLQVFRLPQTFQEEVTISNRFRLKPLLGILNYESRFCLLALSLNRIRLLECSIYGVREFKSEGFPASLSDWSNLHGRETHLQARSTASRGGGQRGTMVHGHGSTGEEKQELFSYLKEVDKEVCRLLGASDLPLILAGVDNVTTAFREITDYGKVLEPSLSGSPERIHNKDLHSKAWELFSPTLEAQREKLLSQYREKKGTGLVGETWQEILPAITQGRVESLLLLEGTTRPGRYRVETLEVELHESEENDSQDLAELAAVLAHSSGSQVHLVERESMPSETDVIAIYRY